MKVRFLGQSGFEIKMNKATLLFDPFITPNPQAKEINIDDIKPDYILITHAHGDHTADVESIAKANDSVCISNYEICNYYGAKDIQYHPLNHGGKKRFDFGMVKYVNAVHTSSFHDGTYGGNPGGFVIWDEDQCFYHAGDTGLTMDMKLIPMTCPKLDFAILPIGDNFTMGYEEALIASDFIGCDKIIGCHFNTFGLIEIDIDKAKSEFSKKGKELITLDIGASIEL